MSDSIKKLNDNMALVEQLSSTIELLDQAKANNNENEVSVLQQKVNDIESAILLSEYSSAQDESILSNGNYFSQNPSKRIGQEKLDTDRWGKDIIIQKGDISNLSEIDVSDDFMQFVLKNSIGISTQKPTITEQVENASSQSFVNNVINESVSSVGRKSSSKTKKTKEKIKDQRYIMPTKAAVQTPSEIYSLLNPEISQEELKCFIWHKSKKKRLSNEWFKLAGLEEDHVFSDHEINEWISKGLLMYFKGEYLPKSIYLSGDMYEKMAYLTSPGQDVEAIKLKGEDVFEAQLKACKESFQKVYSNRLILTGNNQGNALIIKPISRLVKTFMVTELEDEKRFRWYTTKGVPNFLKVEGRSKEHFDELSLFDAFCLWLHTFKSKLDLRANITYFDIIELYLFKKIRQTPRNLDEVSAIKWKAMLERIKSKAQEEGNRLFLKFLNEQLLPEDKLRLETIWNKQYNNYLAPNYDKIPIALTVAKVFGPENPFVIKPEKREAVSFLINEGRGGLAYDVGVGKTISAILSIEQFIFSEYCERPVIIVPNNTYKQWINEIKSILPHRQINDFFNLSKSILEIVATENEEGELVAKRVDKNSITVLTYEGLKQIGFNDNTSEDIMSELYEILNQGDPDKMSKKQQAGFREKLESLIGKGLKGTSLNIEDFGFDFLAFDEAHALRKIFTSVKGSVEETEDGVEKRSTKKQYDLTSGLPSDVALKAFMLSYYVQKNTYGNILALTATPFQNSPLEIFSMLSLLAYDELKRLGLNNINDFFDNFIEITTELTINHRLQPQYKSIVKGFNNLQSLQQLITRFWNYKTGEDVGVIRPNKWVIPYTKKIIKDRVEILDTDEQVTSFIPLSGPQEEYMADVIDFAEEKIGYSELISRSEDRMDYDEESEDELKSEEAQSFNVTDLDSESLNKARAILSMNFSRNIALSPFLYPYHSLGTPTYKTFVGTSPKIHYVLKCIESVRNHHLSKKEPISGQVIYMDRGIKYFPLIKEYLIKEIGYKDHEIGIITSQGMNEQQKAAVQDAFLGREFDSSTSTYMPIDDSLRIKVLIGSSSIREGLNLQKFSTVLYNCFIDWNPTDNVQLHGRIWRQGNVFKNVRIVHPLMLDSSDIFMFQKLEEKTSRINSIWSNDGKSSLRIEEFDPEELKKNLIRDPRVIAKIDSIQSKSSIQDELKFNTVLIERLQAFIEAKAYIDSKVEDVIKFYNEFNQSAPAESMPISELIVKTNKLGNSSNLTDKEGKIILESYQRNQLPYSERMSGKYADFSKPYTPYFMSTAVIYNRLIDKEKRELLDPREIQPNEIGEYIAQIQTQNEDLKQKVEFLESEDWIRIRAEEIIEERRKNKIRPKNLDELVKEFSSLNFLLDFKYCNFNRKTSKNELEVVSEDLKQIEEAIRNMEDLLHLFEGEEKLELENTIAELTDLKKLF